jgi:hypothetical protein
VLLELMNAEELSPKWLFVVVPVAGSTAGTWRQLPTNPLPRRFNGQSKPFSWCADQAIKVTLIPTPDQSIARIAVVYPSMSL